MCLRVFYQGPWLEGKEKGVLFLPSRPVIMFTANLALSFRQLGPVPIWRDLQSYERCFGGQTLSRSCLVWNSIPHRPLKKKKKHSSTEFPSIYIWSLYDWRIYCQRKMRMVLFSPLTWKNRLPGCIFEGLRPCWLSHREAPCHSSSSGGRSSAGQSGLGF